MKTNNPTQQNRRHFLGASVAIGAALTTTATSAAKVEAKKNRAATYVLVHGAWHGGWCWKHTKALLEQSGHRVFAPTLTGMGERHHLSSASIDLNTHIRDVAAIIESEELSHVILVGHSYGGYIVAGVANLMPEKIAHIVYLDAMLPMPGKAARETWPPELVAQTEKTLIDGFKLASFPIAMFDVPPTDTVNTAWMQRRLTDMPYGVFKTPFPETPAANATAVAKINRTFIKCLNAQLDGAKYSYAAAKSMGMRLREIKTGHNPMVTAPAILHKALLSL